MLTNLDKYFPSRDRPNGAKARQPGQPPSPHSRRNRILAGLPKDALVSLAPYLEFVPLKRRQTLHERNVPLAYAYFLEDGVASLLARVAARGFYEVGLLGCSDFVGLPLVLGTERTPHRCVMQTSGSAFRISADHLDRALSESPSVRTILLAYAQATMVETAQLAVCNSSHNLKQRLARCLLAIHDRVPGDEIPLTHQTLSRTLGVRRAGVTTAMGRLEEAGLLHRGRGHIMIANKAGVEAEACECYRTIRSEHQRLVWSTNPVAPTRSAQSGAAMLLAS
jgi:CRP-like cAMP-binding protein